MKELIKKFSAFSVGPIVGAMLGFLTVPAVTYFISPEEYGKSSMFVLAQGTISMVMYLGMDQAFVREFNLFKETKDKLMTNAIIVPFASVLIFDAIILLNKEWVSEILFGDRQEVLAVYMLALMLPFMIIENFSLLKIRMEEKGLQYSFFTILLKTLVLIITLTLLLTYQKTFRSVIIAIALSEIINGTLLFIISRRNLKLKVSYIDKKLLSRMLKFGLPLIPASILGWILASMDKIMLRTICGYGELGLYSAAFKIVNVLAIVQTCFVLFWTPVAYRWYEEGKGKKNFNIAGRLVAFVMTNMCLGILLFKDIVLLLLGKDFGMAIYIFPFLLINPIMYTISETTSMGIGFTRNTGYNVIVSFVAGVVNVGLNYLLIPIMGGKGAAVATGISYVVFFWMRTLISRKLWIKLDIGIYVYYSLIILANSAIHTFVGGYIPYIFSGVSILATMLVNGKNLMLAIGMIRGKGEKDAI